MANAGPHFCRPHARQITSIIFARGWCPHQSTPLPVVWCYSAAAPTTVLVVNFQNTYPALP